MSKDEISRPDPMLFAEDSLANRSVRRESSELKTTPAISGRKCLGLSGNAGPLGLLEKTLLGSSDCAWTKFSLTWKAKATPQGRLIYQLARQAPRISADDSGLLHTPTAKANQMAPSMATRDSGSWGSTLGGAKPHHMVPTPTTMDHIERKNTNLTPSTGKINYETNKSVSLDRWVKMWPTPTASDHKGSGPTVVRKDGKLRNDRLDYAVEQFWPTPNAREKGGGEYQDPEKIKARMEKGHQSNLGDMVKLWPTPRVSMVNGPSVKEIEAGDPKRRLETAVKFWPTPTSMTGGEGVAPSHLDGSHGWNIGAAVNAADPKNGGKLNPKWVAWLMGYPIEYLNSVPWETASSRRSRKKSEKQ